MGQAVTIAYDNVKVAPYKLVKLLDLTVTKMMNRHAHMTFTGIVPEEEKDRYVAMTSSKTPVQLSYEDAQGERKVLFCGIVLDIEVKAVRDVYHLEVKAVSYSYLLDRKRKSRSFQNNKMAYLDLMKRIGGDYAGFDVIDSVSNGAKLEDFVIQYKETDWAFLKRIASRFHAGLIPVTIFEAPKILVGIQENQKKVKLDNAHYKVDKRMTIFHKASENEDSTLQEQDFIYYEVEAANVLEVGDHVDFQGKDLYVYAAYSEMKNGLLRHQYTLSVKKGLRQPVIYHSELTGASVQGKVIDVAKDTVKVHLEIDPVQNKSEAHWFPYASVYTAEGNSGWYCMPELGDHVRVYFPSNKEEEGTASSSVRQDNSEQETNKLGDPNYKYFRTASGKEIMMGPNEVTISAKDGEVFIKLNEQDGIEIVSAKGIQLISDQDIVLDAGKKLVISAQEEISLSCQGSSVSLDGNVTLSGNEVKTNG